VDLGRLGRLRGRGERITGWILGLLPFAVGGSLYLIAPDHVSLLFTDPLGLQMVGVVSVLMVIGIFWMRRIIDIEI
jgi:tight adherence protein B